MQGSVPDTAVSSCNNAGSNFIFLFISFCLIQEKKGDSRLVIGEYNMEKALKPISLPYGLMSGPFLFLSVTVFNRGKITEQKRWWRTLYYTAASYVFARITTGCGRTALWTPPWRYQALSSHLHRWLGWLGRFAQKLIYTELFSWQLCRLLSPQTVHFQALWDSILKINAN